jgi:cytochrome P450
VNDPAIQPLQYQPFSRENASDPYPHYHALRDEDPVHYSSVLRGWLLTRYADVVTVLRDQTFSVNRYNAKVTQEIGLPMIEPELFEIVGTISRILPFLDPPAHTRMRSLVSKAFTPRTVLELRPKIQAFVDAKLDHVAQTGRMDIVHEIADTLPIHMIGELLGVPQDYRQHLKRWADAFTVFAEPPSLMRNDLVVGALEGGLEMRNYLDGLFEERRARPTTDMISTLLAIEEGTDRLTEDDVFAMCGVLLYAGYETSANFIGNAVIALLDHPQERARLLENPGLIRTAIDEFMRYDGSVQLNTRVAMRDLELGGKQICKGDLVVTCLGAANRDPAKFRDPDKLDIGRTENHHVGFGFGIHYCFGGPLALLEAEVVVETLLRRFPRFQPAYDTLTRRDTVTIRGVTALPITLE